MGPAALAFSAEKGGAALSQLSRTLTAPMGRNFDSEFRPDLTPKEMLALGVFCGKYMTDCREEFPASWFAHARCSPSGRDCSLNYYGVDASQPLSVWRS